MGRVMSFKFEIGDVVGNIFDADTGEIVAREIGDITGEPQYKVLGKDDLGDWVLWLYEDSIFPV